MKRTREDDNGVTPNKQSKQEVSFSSLPNDTIGIILSFLDAQTLTNSDIVLSTKTIYQFLQTSSNEFWKQVFINNFSDQNDCCRTEDEFGNEETSWYDMCDDRDDSFLKKNLSVFNCGSVQAGEDFADECDKVEHNWKRIVHEKSIVQKWFETVKGIWLPIGAATEVVLDRFYVYNDSKEKNLSQMFDGGLVGGFETSVEKEIDGWISETEDEEEKLRLKKLKTMMMEYKQKGNCSECAAWFLECDDVMAVQILYLKNSDGSFLGLYNCPQY
jgi:hypothetical protein